MRRESFGKRLLSMLMALVLIVGILPAAVFADDTVVLDAAIFCSDVHGSSSDLTSVLGGIKTSGVDYSSIGFVGDTCLTVANTTSTVQSALGDTDIEVMFSYAASHDTENSADISTNWNYSGEVENVSQYYLVYTIRETDMQNNNGAEANFTTWYNGLTDAQKQLPIFIMSHRPLHERRNDNAGAASWYTAISAAAETSDIVFFWAHNHTGENSVDTNAYYVAKNGSETITVEGGSTVVPNFTYMNAGYINANGQNPARKGVATTVQITADSLIFQDYNSSGEYSGTYAHNVTVTRDNAPKEATVTPKKLEVSGGTLYRVGESVDLTADVSEITVTYSDGTTETLTGGGLSLDNLTYKVTDSSGSEVAEPFTTAGTYTLTYTYTLTVDDKTYEANAPYTITVDDRDTVTYADYLITIQATAWDLTAIAAENVWGEPDLSGTFSDYVAYDVTLTGHTDGNEVSYSWLLVDEMDTTNLALYYVADDGTLTAVPFELVTDEQGNQYLEFTTTYVGTFAYGALTIPEDYTLTGLEVTNVTTTKYFVGESLDMVNPVVTAIYTNDAGETYTAVVFDAWELTYDMTKVGKQTVTVSYTEGDVTVSDTFEIEIFQKVFPDEDTGVSVEVTTHGATAITADISTNTNVSAAVSDVIKDGTYVAYDIELAGYNDGESVIVTLPIPDGVSNPVVYYVSDDGATVTNMNATKGDGVVTFTTTHFSTYVVGESTEITVPDPTTATVTGATTTEEKTVYVLVSTPTAGNQYIIVSSNSAGSAYALKENTTTGTSVTINAAGNGISAPYIETSDETIMWNAASDMTFQSENGGYYLRQSSSGGSRSLSFSTSQSTNWNVDTNSLSYQGNRNTYYVSGGSTWSLSSSSANVYFYEKQTVTVTTSANGTYSIAGNPAEVTKVVVEGTTVTLGSTLTFVPESGTTTTTDTSATAIYTVVDGGDPNGIISGISGNTVTFTGKYGKALVKVSYTVTVNGTDYTVDNYITVTASEPTYDIQISQDGTTAASDIIAFRGVTADAALELSYILTYEDADGVETLTPASGITWYCYLPSGADASAIASIDQTGKLTFTGEEGTVKVMVSYETDEGTSVTDIITVNVRKSNAVTPDESTTDFPRWPDEGAVRFDKTATAVGNFSETGIAQVELSMAGIPVKTGGAVDVVIMLDMTGSMSSTAMTAAEESAIAFAEQIVKNDDGTYNDSRIAILAFNSGSNSPFTYWELGTVDNDTEWSSLCTAVRGASDDQVSGGTPYDEALAKCQEILAAAKTDGTGNDRQQFCVFVSDGGPTSYEYITNYDEVKAGTATAYTTSTASATGGSNQSDSNFATIATYTHEYYSTLMKDAGVTMYSVLTGLSATDYPNCTTILQNIASDTSKAYVVEDGSDTSALTNAFTAIAAEINAAATNVEVEDVITPEYDLIFELPNANITGLPDGQEFYIEVVDYPLDETTHERTGTSKILQRIYLATVDGKVTITKITYTDDSGNVVEQTITPVYTAKANETDKAYFDASGTYYPDGDGTHHMTSGAYVVLNDDGTLKSLHTPNFTYVAADKKLNWTVTSMSQTSEVALRYFVYLKNSGGVAADQQIDAGTYPTNEYATLTYTNHLGNDCEQIFPVPQMTWNGAQVSYVFYLVNENGVPVNRAGREITFAEAIFVTDIYTYAIVWNDLEQSAGLEASYLASQLLPDAYSLYDVNASYKIHVYEDEAGVNLNNHFIIAGTSGDTTTYVYNNKTDVTKYNVHGTYAASGTYLCKSYSVTATVENGQITAAAYTAVSGETQVAWNDLESTTGAQNIGGYAYYIDENGDVYTIVQKTDATAISGFDFANTTVAFAVVWEKKLVEDTVVVDFGLPVDIDVVSNDFVYNYVTGIGATDPNYGINSGYKTDTGALTAQELTVSGHSVMILDQNRIRFTPGSMEFNAPVRFYYETTVEAYENDKVVPSYMYSSVTVIPATTIYYEDDFLTLTSYTKGEDGTFTEDAASQWTQEGTAVSATQAQDRPGESQISASLDADNNYGYDSAYDSMSTYSMGSAVKINVNASTRGEATFTFYGTGFDVIGLTSNATGTLTIQVYSGAAASGTAVKTSIVETYYGYTYTEADGWVETTGTGNALYQVPVMKISGLTYGQYTVKITAGYNDYFNHTATEGSYDLYLDAIRIYDPTGNNDATANGAYVADGEGWPVYSELRNNVIAAADITADSATLNGMVFIDGIGETATYTDYVSYGPNNELYLAAGQAVVFSLNLPDNVASAQLGMKSVGGTAKYVIADASTISEQTDLTGATATTISTATDMYYDITSIADKAIVVYCSEGTLSLTNVKLTFTKETAVDSLYYVSYETVKAVVQGMNTVEPTVTVETDNTVTEGDVINVTVTTSDNVSAVSVNGTVITTYEVVDGKYVWTAEVTAEAAGAQTISVVAYDQYGNAYAADDTTVTVEAKTETVEETIKTIVSTIISNLKSWFGWNW